MYFLLILLVAASRFLPHPPNVACIGALGLFAGCYLTGYRAYLVPLAALLSSDLLGQILGTPGIGFYHPTTMVLVYAGVLAAVPVGRFLQGRHAAFVPAASLVASSLFFLSSNFGVWLGGWYSMNVAGLVGCYVAAIPFFGYTIAGDLLFSSVLFGAWEFSRRGMVWRSHAAAIA